MFFDMSRMEFREKRKGVLLKVITAEKMQKCYGKLKKGEHNYEEIKRVNFNPS